jgi:hypothetical protein
MLLEAERLANHTANAIAFDRATGCAHGNRKSQPRERKPVATCHHGKEIVGEARALRMHRIELRFAAQALLQGEAEASVNAGIAAHRGVARPRRARERGAYGMSFLRPLARRRARTLRPFFVAMRARNPCVRLRRTLLG